MEGHGYLRDDKDDARLYMYLEHQCDEYFNSEMFIQLVGLALEIFDRRFSDATGIFLFDNARSHKKYPPDALNPSNMNVYPGDKQTIMRPTVWDGRQHEMVLPDGRAMGMKIVLREHGVDFKD